MLDELRNLEGLKENEPLANHTMLKVGGPARYFFVARTRGDLVRAVRVAHDTRIPFAIIGGGTNTLASDKGFDGLVIKVAVGEVRIGEKEEKGRKGEGKEGGGGSMIVEVGAGTPSVLFARKVGEAGLAGLEWMVTLPGTVGGAVYGNAGAFGSETKDYFVSVDLLRFADGEWKEERFAKDQCAFGYRDSVFKHLEPRPVILGATFTLPSDDGEAIERRMKELLEKRAAEQPLGVASAGCVFKNYEVRDARYEDVEKNFDPEDRPRLQEFFARGCVPAGWLIEKAGMKGFCVGKVCVSEKHANFSVNRGGATADEIMQLISVIKTKVRDLLGFQLGEEVQYIGR